MNMPKYFWIALLPCAFLLVGSAALADPSIGDTRQEVLAELGEPSGFLKADDYEIMYFERGKIVLREGRVAVSEVLSPDAYHRKLVLEHEARERRQQRLAEEQRRLLEEGAARKERLLSDGVFLASSARNQVAVWKSFHERYPGIDVSMEYGRALEAYERELEVQRTEQRLADLEKRLQQAEAQARLADARAQEAEQRLVDRRRSSVYSVGSYAPIIYAPAVVPTKSCTTRPIPHSTLSSGPKYSSAFGGMRPWGGGYRSSYTPHSSVPCRPVVPDCGSGINVRVRF